MIAPRIPEDDVERTRELYKYELLDTVYESEFDELVRLASKICNVPISLITLVDVDRQWFKAKHGLDANQTSRNVSFCGHAVLSEQLFEVNDAMGDERFYDNPLVTGKPNIRYYAGMPLVTQKGYKIGTLCVIDRKPRELDIEQKYALDILSKQVIKLFDLRLRNKEKQRIIEVQQKMMSIMAHDIRGPLNALRMTYDLKNEGMLTDEELTMMDKLVPNQLDSTVTLLNNIVDWGTLQLSQFSPVIEYVDLRKNCDECIDVLQMQANAKGNTLVNNIEPGFGFNGNVRGVGFVLHNLLGNANKFTKDGTITVSADKGDGVTHIYVSDTGIGMQPEVMEAINSRQWTGTALGTNNEKGSGMGLKLVFEYLDNIKAGIRFGSELGKGTTVMVTLPDEA